MAYERVYGTISQAFMHAAKNGKRPLVTISRGGGLGDNLQACFAAHAIKKIWPTSYIMLLLRNDFGMVGLINNAWKEEHGDCLINNVVNLAGFHYANGIYEAFEDNPDVFIDMRYTPKIRVNDSALEFGGMSKWREEFEASWGEWQEYLWRGYPLSSHSWAHQHVNLLKYQFGVMKLPYTDRVPMASENVEDFVRFCGLEPGRYVTVACGAGGSAKQKEWPFSRDVLDTESEAGWKDIAAYIKARGLQVVQLGLPRETKLPEGLSLSLLGKTPLPRACGILKNAAFHVGIEGGFIHIARNLGTQCVCIHGPTGKTQFGYDDCVNVGHEFCMGCFWKTDKWFESKCPMKHKYCINFPSSDEVRAGIDEAIRRTS